MASYTSLNIILNNVDFAVHELMGLAIANKNSNGVVYENLAKKHAFYEKEINKGRILPNYSVNKAIFCSVCNNSKTSHVNPFTDKVTCINCCKLMNISETYAKKTYKLTSEDLERINCHQSYCRIYRTTMTLYSKKDVIGLTLIKYGIRNIANIPVKVRKSVLSAKEKRIEQLNNCFEQIASIDENDKEQIKKLDICVEFLKNGTDGISKLRKQISLWDDFIEVFLKNEYLVQEIILKNSSKMYEYFEAFMVKPEHTKKYMDNENKRIFSTQQRTLELTNALEAVDLTLRDDSSMCRQYICGEEDDLEMVVNMMREMDFFYMYTNYELLMSNELNDAYEEAKTYIYHDYGYIHDHEEYLDVLHSHVDKHNISRRIKKRILKNYKGVIPDFVNKY